MWGPSLVLLPFAADMLLQSRLSLYVPCPVPIIPAPSMVSLLFLLELLCNLWKDWFSSVQHDRTSHVFSLLAQKVTKNLAIVSSCHSPQGLMAPTKVLQSSVCLSHEGGGKWEQAGGDASPSHSCSHIRKSRVPNLKSLTSMGKSNLGSVFCAGQPTLLLVGLVK